MGNVWGQSPPEPSPLLDTPWRKVEWDKRDALLKSVKECQIENIKHIRILLHGPAGAGKSSFINSVSSILQGRMVHDALVDAVGGKSFTLKYRTHTIKNGETVYPFVFTDIMGIEGGEGIQETDITLAMKGHVKDDYTFKPAAAMSDKDPHYNHHPTPEDKVYVLVCIVSADKESVLPKAVLDKIRNIRLKARDMDIPQIGILTKIDAVHPLMKKDVKNVYEMKIVKEKMEEFSARVGIPVNCIFPVKNYHEEADLDDDIDVLILKAVQKMIDLGVGFIEFLSKKSVEKT